MCGFAGIIHWDKEKILPEDLERMAFLLRHRGPDEQRVAFPSEGIGLSHCRLKVIDLSEAARQPMSNEEKTVWLLFNGEIYNFKELRTELEAKGFHFRSGSDTEVVLRAYEAWGCQGIRRLDGMFSIALWDGRNREGILARDRTGKKPLYYWTDGRCLVFGSEIKGLLAHAHVPCRVDEKGLGALLAFGYPPGGESCYQQIRQVPPATFLRFRGGQMEPVRETYWALPPITKEPPLPVDEACRELRQLLTEAVRRRLVADVPLGAFLSGGLDSSIVVGLMARLHPGQSVKTFSIGFEGDSRFNETRFAEQVAKRFGTQHTVFIVRPQSFDLVERLVWHHDQPFGDSSALPSYLLCELTRSHVTVALNGDGGDELFAGYERFWAAHLSEQLPPWVRRLGMVLCDRLPGRFDSRSRLGRVRRFFEAAQEPLIRRYFQWTSTFSNPEEILLSGSNGNLDSLLKPYAPYLAGRSDRSVLSRLLFLNFHEYLPNDLNVKMDRCSMAHGLETRSPFLDTALIEWAFRLPDSFKLRRGVSKWILRRAFTDFLPPAIRDRGKMGFGVPLGSWFRGKWRPPLQDYLLSPQARIFRYLNQKQVERMVNNHLEGALDAGHPLWLLLTLEVWLRQMEQPRFTPHLSSLSG